MWKRAEAIAAVCRDDSRFSGGSSRGGNNSNSSSNSNNDNNGATSSSSSSSSNRGADGGEDSLAWDEEEAPEPKAEAAAEAEAEAETPAATSAEGDGEETAAAAAVAAAAEEEKAPEGGEAEEEVAIDEAYLGPDSVLVTITGCNDGGLLTSLAGLPAFIPFSQVEAASLGLPTNGRDPQAGTRNRNSDSPSSRNNRAWLTAAAAAPAVGQKVRAVPTEVDASQERIVLSVRAAAELSARQQLKVGALIWGTVRKAASYGLFVGIDGTRESALLHATNISRGARLPESPLDVLPLGSRVRALVVGMDDGGRRLSLSTAEIEENDGDMLVDAEKVYAGAEEQALYFRRHLEALAAQEAAGGGGGGGYGNNNSNNRGGGGSGSGGQNYGNARRSTYNNNYNNNNNNTNGNKRGNNNNRRYYDDDGDDGSREWSSG